MWLLSIIFVTFLWASVLLISEVLKLPSPLFVFFRLVFSMIIVLPCAFKAGIKKPDMKSLLSGILLSLNWIFLFLAVSMIGPSTADFLYYTAPVISLAIAAITGSDVPIWSWIAAGISFVGVMLIYSFTPASPTGIIFALLAAFFYGSVVVLGKYTSKHVHPFVFTFYQMISATVVAAIFSMKYFKPLNPFELSLLAVAGILNTGIALLLWWKTLRKVNLRVASVLTYLDPAFALLLSTSFLGYKPTMWNIFGGSLIIAGGVLAVWKEMGKR